MGNREDVESRCGMQNSTDLQNEPILMSVCMFSKLCKV